MYELGHLSMHQYYSGNTVRCYSGNTVCCYSGNTEKRASPNLNVSTIQRYCIITHTCVGSLHMYSVYGITYLHGVYGITYLHGVYGITYLHGVYGITYLQDCTCTYTYTCGVWNPGLAPLPTS